MKIFKMAAVTAALVVSTSANAALIERLGGLAYYDDVADLTWLADANAAGTHMNWADSNAWAAGLTVGGVDGWRLANTVDEGNDGATYTSVYNGVDFGYNITSHSELSNMFYNVLGNTACYDSGGVSTGCTFPTWGLTNTGPFSNLQSDRYWSATEYALSSSHAWTFNMQLGMQAYNGDKTGTAYAWAVQSGDVSAVPVPAAVWLFGSGLVGLVGLARRKRHA